MSAAQVRSALARLRDLGRRLRERRAADVHAALADTLDAWCGPASQWQRALADALPAVSGFSAEMVREGLARGLAPYTGGALHALVRDELGGPERQDAMRGTRVDGFATAATVLAGAIPLPTFVAITAPLALHTPVLVKPSMHDPVSAALFVRSLAARDPLLGACVEIATFHRDDTESLAALCEAECVVATGSDAAVAAIARCFEASRGHAASGPRRFVGYGHRSSLAMLGSHATRGDALTATATALALDIALWDQLGCLSPLAVHVVGADRRAAGRVAEALAAALAAAEQRSPRGRIEPAAAAAIARERAEAEMRDATVLSSRGTEWSVVCEPDAQRRSAPLHRFVRVKPSASVEACLAALRPQGGQLAAVALAGFGADTAEIGAALAELGASRVCAPGAMQSPPLGWPRDNLRVLLPLARFGALECE
jgi:Acyl-CoA reductase (LuxC)